jgi:quinol monooxygenase YgiN
VKNQKGTDMNKRTSDLIIIASAKAKPGKEAELRQALLDVAGPTRAQPGCVSFRVYHALEDPTVMIGLERWTSDEAHERHLQGAHVQTFLSSIADILAEPPQILSYAVVDEE